MFIFNLKALFRRSDATFLFAFDFPYYKLISWMIAATTYKFLEQNIL